MKWLAQDLSQGPSHAETRRDAEKPRNLFSSDQIFPKKREVVTATALNPGESAAGLGASDGPRDCRGHTTRTRYYATAVPLVFGKFSGRSFAVNANSVIWQVSGATAPTEPFRAPAMPIQ